MTLHIKTLNIQTVPLYVRDPVIYKLGGVSLKSVQIGARVKTDQLFYDWFKTNHTPTSSWGVSIFNSGTGVIGGVLTENLLPVSNCFMYLYQSSSGILAKQAISESDGSFKFTGVVPDIAYFIVAVHKAKKYNAVVVDEVRIDSAVVTP